MIDRVHVAAVFSSHGLGREQSIQHRFFDALDGRHKHRVESIVTERIEAQARLFRQLARIIGSRKGEKNIARIIA